MADIFKINNEYPAAALAGEALSAGDLLYGKKDSGRLTVYKTNNDIERVREADVLAYTTTEARSGNSITVNVIASEEEPPETVTLQVSYEASGELHCYIQGVLQDTIDASKPVEFNNIPRGASIGFDWEGYYVFIEHPDELQVVQPSNHRAEFTILGDAYVRFGER